MESAKLSSLENLIGGVLIGASMFLTVHSILRMSLMNITKRWEFPFMNGAMVVNEVAIMFYMFASEKVFGSNSGNWLLWLSVVNNFAYFISKPLALWLAYLRCRSVFPEWRKADWFHYSFMGIRTIELFGIFICNIIVNTACQGNYYLNKQCEGFLYVGKIRDLSAPIWRIYYIISESIFFYAIFRFLFQRKTEETKTKLVRYRRMQAIIFGADLILLVAMSIYRMIYVFGTGPSYQYAELFSTALTFFNLTEFGLNLRVLYSKTDTTYQNSHGTSSKALSKPDNPASPKRSYSISSTLSSPTEINHLDAESDIELVPQSDPYSNRRNHTNNQQMQQIQQLQIQQQQLPWSPQYYQDQNSQFGNGYVIPQALIPIDSYSNTTSPRESIDGYTGLRRPSIRQMIPDYQIQHPKIYNVQNIARSPPTASKSQIFTTIPLYPNNQQNNF
ncbi:hypothetical protein HK098_007369 [Nowakowskiella sp. JEL0407]|nr:hypothetical protein HK098_007369 [Nowakowskiella sp. JEL0407]